MSFPKFPNFRKFSIEDKKDYLKYYSQLDAPYCDFSIDDLCMWLDYHHDLEACELNDNIILRFTNIIDKDIFYFSLVGISNLDSTINELKQITPKLLYVPEQTASLMRQLSNQRLNIVEDINNRDYVYNVDNLLEMQGKPYENLRRRINHFKREYPDTELRRFDLDNPTDKQIIEKTVAKWSRRDTALRNDPEGWEFNAIKTHLTLAQNLTVQAYGLYVNDKLVNINMFHLPPHKGWLIFNHIKCDYNYKDIYGYAFYSLFTVAKSQGIKWVNFEQDLGIEGLQRIKTFFRPSHFLRRYSVTFDSEAKYQ